MQQSILAVTAEKPGVFIEPNRSGTNATPMCASTQTHLIACRKLLLRPSLKYQVIPAAVWMDCFQPQSGVHHMATSKKPGKEEKKHSLLTPKEKKTAKKLKKHEAESAPLSERNA